MTLTQDKPCQGGCGKVRSILFSDSPAEWLCNDCRVKGRSRKQTYDVYWAPEGRCIATVEAVNTRKALRQAPQPYRKYLGEMWAYEVKDSRAKCNVDLDCPRHVKH